MFNWGRIDLSLVMRMNMILCCRARAKSFSLENPLKSTYCNWPKWRGMRAVKLDLSGFHPNYQAVLQLAVSFLGSGLSQYLE